MNNLDPGPIPAFLDRTKLVHSYTSLHTYNDVCPHQYWHKFILKDIPFEKTDAMDYGNKVHEAMELRVGAKKPLHSVFAQWEPFAAPFDSVPEVKCEQKLGITSAGVACDFWAKDVWLRVKVDVNVIAFQRAFITDWKTGNSNYEDRFELDVQALLLNASKPDLKEIFGYYAWLKDNKLGARYDLSDTRATWNKVNGIVKSIERDRGTGQFEKRRSGLCGYCQVKSCEHRFEAKPK